jgi:hypothetical protein
MKYQVGDIIRVQFPAFNNPYGVIVNVNNLWNDGSKFIYHVVIQGKPEKVLYLYENQLFVYEELLEQL